jgi:hypothetical protein
MRVTGDFMDYWDESETPSDFVSDPRAMIDATYTEAQWQAQIIQAAESCGWKHYHTHDSRRSTAGFPDLVMVRGDRMLVIECKKQDDKTPPRRMAEQQEWIDAIDGVTEVTAFVARPSDWDRVTEALE